MIIQVVPKIKTLIVTVFLLSMSAAFDLHAAPICQVLDKSASRLEVVLDLFGSLKKSRVEKIKAFLWVDPENPEEGAALEALIEPQISKLFGNFEQNPLMMGMLANYLDKDLVFKSSSVVRKAGTDKFTVNGQVISGSKKYPADFNVARSQIGSSQSRFTAKVESDNFEKILGAPGSAKGDFDLIFLSKPAISKQECTLAYNSKALN